MLICHRNMDGNVITRLMLLLLVAATLGLGKYTVAISVCTVLLGLVWRGSHKLRLDFKVISTCVLGSVVGELMVIGTYRLLF